MFKKKILAITLALALLGGIWVAPEAIASGANYEVEVIGKEDALQYNGNNTYTVEVRVRANNGARVRGLECNIAYDTSVFELVTMDAMQSLSEMTNDGILTVGPSYSLMPDPEMYDFAPSLPAGWTPQLCVARSGNGQTAYVSMQPYRMSGVLMANFTTLHRIRLAFKDGKSLDDVSSNTIRFITTTEMTLLGTDCQIKIYDESTGIFHYGRLSGSDALPEPVFVMERGALSQHTITVTAESNGTAYGGGTFYEGTNIILTAAPDLGYTFDGWYENNIRVSGAISFNFTVTRNRTLVARFVELGPDTATVAVTASPSQGGTVWGGGTHNRGTNITLTATPNAGYSFDGWYENNVRVSTNASYGFDLTNDRTLVARFIELKMVSISVTAGSGGTVSGGGTFYEGTNVTLTATPDSEHRFYGWFENNVRISGAGVNYNFIATTDRNLEARFTDNPEIIVRSTSHSTSAHINLTREEIFLDGITVAAFSVNRGLTWKRGALPTGARFNRLFDRELTLVIAQELDSKRRPVGIFVVFPTITARPRANLERVAPWYGEATWNLTKRRTATPTEKDYEWVPSSDGRTAVAGASWQRITNGRCDIAIGQPRTRETYLFRTPASGDGSVANPYTPSSRIFRVRPRPFLNTPNYRIDTRKNSIRLRNGDWFTIANGAVQQSSGGHLDLTNISAGTRIRIWRGQTGIRPPSLTFELTV